MNRGAELWFSHYLTIYHPLIKTSCYVGNSSILMINLINNLFKSFVTNKQAKVQPDIRASRVVVCNSDVRGGGVFCSVVSKMVSEHDRQAGSETSIESNTHCIPQTSELMTTILESLDRRSFGLKNTLN